MPLTGTQESEAYYDRNSHLHPQCQQKAKIPSEFINFQSKCALYVCETSRLQLKNIARKLVVYRHVSVMDSNSFISIFSVTPQNKKICDCRLVQTITYLKGRRTNSSREKLNILTRHSIHFSTSPHRRATREDKKIQHKNANNNIFTHSLYL